LVLWEETAVIGARLLVAVLALCSVAVAGDKEFDQIVGAIEKHYGVTKTHIPLMGVANLFVKTAHPQGVSGFRIAVFEDLKGAEGDSDFMDRLDLGLHRLVRVRSSADGEATYIYAADAGKSTRVLVATFESNQATVVEVKADMDALVRLLGDPTHMGKALSGEREE
jgi:hypothetical protein